VNRHVLVVEDRPSLRKLMRRALEQGGYRVTVAEDGHEGERRARAGGFDLVLTDLKLPGPSGLDVLAASRAAHPQVPVVVVTAYGTVAMAVEAMKRGALDFLEKPVEIDDLLALVASAVEPPGAVGEGSPLPVFQVPGGPAIVGRHPRLRAALKLLRRVAPTDSTVLLTGESGTGKELFAQTLHALSQRATGPFVAVNCAALPASLMENELFGHEKGAFTGADRQHAGRFELAEGGTLFLDEIGELEMGVQAKVLRVLDEGGYERVGGGETRRANVRIVAATNRPLQRMVDDGTFRADLYFRLEVFPVDLPPLRERASDIPLLARHLIERIAHRHQRATPLLDAEGAALLEHHPWRGNVRELANVLERAVILAEEPRLDAAALRPLLHPTGPPPQGTATTPEEAVRQALREADGDKPRAAEALGISYRTLQRRIKEFDLEGYPKYRG
jgi:two-component system, NtrC family, response regulator AtoC